MSCDSWCLNCTSWGKAAPNDLFGFCSRSRFCNSRQRCFALLMRKINAENIKQEGMKGKKRTFKTLQISQTFYRAPLADTTSSNGSLLPFPRMLLWPGPESLTFSVAFFSSLLFHQVLVELDSFRYNMEYLWYWLGKSSLEQCFCTLDVWILCLCTQFATV